MFIQQILRKVVQRNGYWVYPEQLLLAMVADGNQATREEAVRLIVAARQLENCRCHRQLKVTSFQLSVIN